ncbi:hypothetical protein ACI6Q2_18860 [Chitinophagaceae bacterium LWZ2-11]
MTLPLDTYQRTLISEILLVATQDEVKKCCDSVVEQLQHHKVHGHIVMRFLDKVISELEGFSPMNRSAEQWSNIKTARVYLNRIKQ